MQEKQLEIPTFDITEKDRNTVMVSLLINTLASQTATTDLLIKKLAVTRDEETELWDQYNKAQVESRTALLQHVYETFAIVNIEGLTNGKPAEPEKKRGFFYKLFNLR